ncbi:MAG: hypothetical protein RJA55_1192 [Acidobacteriota bacterium]|jgi:hypothetical protein
MSDTGTKAGCNCGCNGAGPVLTEFLRNLGPSERVSQHFKNAHLEILKGLSALLDEQIAARTGGPRHDQGTRITVD